MVDWADDTTSDKSENTQAIPGYFTEVGYPAMVPCFPGTMAESFGQVGYGGDNRPYANAMTEYGTADTSLNCPWCEVNHACPYWSTGEKADEGGTEDNIKINCETVVSDAANAWDGDVNWFIGRDCSEPSTFIMPLKTPYGYFLWQTSD
jgi:hypothetical protein